MAQFDTTTFVNVDDKDFEGYFGGEPYMFKAGESRQIVIFIAKHLAKHLIDRILQEKHGIKNTLTNTDIRQNLMVKILPDEAIKANVKPLTIEEEKAALEKVLNKQADTIKDLQGRQSQLEEKLSDRKSLEEEIEYLKQELAKVVPKESQKKMGRPSKKITLPVSPVPESPEN